jgi:hypothetical protein
MWVVAQTLDKARRRLASSKLRGVDIEVTTARLRICGEWLVRVVKGQRALPVFRAFQEGPEGVLVETRERGKLVGQVFAVPPGFIQGQRFAR